MKFIKYANKTIIVEDTIEIMIVLKAIITKFSNKEWALEGGKEGYVGENGWVSLSKTSGWDVSGT